jgi:hypothetical protein
MGVENLENTGEIVKIKHLTSEILFNKMICPPRRMFSEEFYSALSQSWISFPKGVMCLHNGQAPVFR